MASFFGRKRRKRVRVEFDSVASEATTGDSEMMLDRAIRSTATLTVILSRSQDDRDKCEAPRDFKFDSYSTTG